MVPWNSALGGFAYNWQSKWVGIIAIKTENNKHQTRNYSLQTVNYKWSWKNIQCVKDFAALLLALYKRGRAILFKFRFRWHSFRRNLAVVVFVDKRNSKNRSPRLPPFCSASFRGGSAALSVGHPRGTHSRYVTGCCLIPLEICGVKNNSRRITYGIGCIWGMPSLSPL